MNEVGNIDLATATSYVVQNLANNPLSVSLMRIKGREGKTTYYADDIIIDWYYCSHISGFGRGGYGTALWGAFVMPDNITTVNAVLLQEDDTEILNEIFDISEVGQSMGLLIQDADRGGNNPYKVKLLPGATLISAHPREITVEKI